MSGTDYLATVREEKDDYPGFSLIVGDCNGLYLFSNRDPTNSIVSLPCSSTFGLTNSLLEDGWFKSSHGVSLVKNMQSPDPDLVASLAKESDYRSTFSPSAMQLDQMLQPFVDILSNRERPGEDEPVDVYEKAGKLAPIFVDVLDVSSAAHTVREYGTRCSIVVLVDMENRVTFYERSLTIETRKWHSRVFHFQAEQSS
jgi:uncharacterized protein with NRDE domain